MWSDSGSEKSFSLLYKWIVRLQMLKRLSLHDVWIDDEIFEKVMSSCPLIQHLLLDCCKGWSTIKVNKARNLKHFGVVTNGENDKSIEINDDAPSLETIRIEGGYHPILYHHKNYYFPRLKTLKLWDLHLPTELLNNLSSNNNFPCLEELELHNCSGFREFELSNCSIKRLIFSGLQRPIKATIDAPNMLYFESKSSHLPTFSGSPIWRDCKSQIVVWRDIDAFELSKWSGACDLSTWLLKLHELLKSLSQSQISLEIYQLPDLTNKDTCDGGSCEPVVVEHLCLPELYSDSIIRALLNCLFRICRPRYIVLDVYENPPKKRKLAKSIWTTLVKKGEPKIWHQDLEETSIQVSDENANEWRPVQECEFSNNEEIRFRLKWREI